MNKDKNMDPKRNGKLVLGTEDMPADLVEAIAATEMDPRHDHLNHLMYNNDGDDTRPLFDDLIAEQEAFIGPPAPPKIPKMTLPGRREAVYQMMLQDLANRIEDETATYRSDPGSSRSQ